MISAQRKQRRRAAKDAARQQRELTRTQQEAAEKLSAWDREARRRGRFLDAERVWSLYDEHAAEARQLDIEQELRDLCFMHSGRFADPRMLRSGIKYTKPGAEYED